MFIGFEDRTVCFHCGGSFKDWKQTDKPWQKHAAWFPFCVHVRCIKVSTFIRDCQHLRISANRQSVQITNSNCFFKPCKNTNVDHLPFSWYLMMLEWHCCESLLNSHGENTSEICVLSWRCDVVFCRVFILYKMFSSATSSSYTAPHRFSRKMQTGFL
jgi:hypothetical protein